MVLEFNFSIFVATLSVKPRFQFQPYLRITSGHLSLGTVLKDQLLWICRSRKCKQNGQVPPDCRSSSVRRPSAAAGTTADVLVGRLVVARIVVPCGGGETLLCGELLGAHRRWLHVASVSSVWPVAEESAVVAAAVEWRSTASWRAVAVAECSDLDTGRSSTGR